jgi:hypothetical protein
MIFQTNEHSYKYLIWKYCCGITIYGTLHCRNSRTTRLPVMNSEVFSVSTVRKFMLPDCWAQNSARP